MLLILLVVLLVLPQDLVLDTLLDMDMNKQPLQFYGAKERKEFSLTLASLSILDTCDV